MKRFFIFLFLASILIAPHASFAQEVPPLDPAVVDAGKNSLIYELLQGFSVQDVINFVYDPRLALDPSVVRKGATGTGFDYFSEEYGLITEKTLADGLKFRKDNWKYFKKAYNTYGTESYYVLGIIRLETYFGQYKGSRNVANSLYSIYVLDPNRRNFAKRELTNFLTLTKKNRIDTFAVKGSTAGAFGIPQFIPSSFQTFAVDGNGDKKIDLFNNADAILSVGNYLKKNGWGKTEEEKRQAIYSYNHDEGYVNAVMAYGQAIEEEVERALR